MDSCLFYFLLRSVVSTGLGDHRSVGFLHDGVGMVPVDGPTEGRNRQLRKAGVIKRVQETKGPGDWPLFCPDVLGSLVEAQRVVGRVVLPGDLHLHRESLARGKSQLTPAGRNHKIRPGGREAFQAIDIAGQIGVVLSQHTKDPAHGIKVEVDIVGTQDLVLEQEILDKGQEAFFPEDRAVLRIRKRSVVGCQKRLEFAVFFLVQQQELHFVVSRKKMRYRIPNGRVDAGRRTLVAFAVSKGLRQGNVVFPLSPITILSPMILEEFVFHGAYLVVSAFKNPGVDGRKISSSVVDPHKYGCPKVAMKKMLKI
mmetsp:Transcript_29170/g.29602  ORF Transcript_29170/g.29602 Transcript_29170/m.29602 type:complete len:311 (-) Transcript_29170:123-1055(-)